MADQSFKPYVPAEESMKEFTLKAVIFGAFLSIILGAANAYLGLVAGMTVAATAHEGHHPRGEHLPYDRCCG